MILDELESAEQKFLLYWSDYLIDTGGKRGHWIYPDIAGLVKKIRRAAIYWSVSAASEKALAAVSARHELIMRVFPEMKNARHPHRRAVVLCRERKDVPAFREAYYRNDDMAIGRMLGYPECCCRFHNEYGEKYSTMDNRATFFRSLKPFDPLLNNVNMARLISHFPCSYGCAQSAKIAASVLSYINRNHGDDSSGNILRLLRQNFVSYKGIFFGFGAFDELFIPRAYIRELFKAGKRSKIRVRKNCVEICSPGGAVRKAADGVLIFEFAETS